MADMQNMTENLRPPLSGMARKFLEAELHPDYLLARQPRKREPRKRIFFF